MATKKKQKEYRAAPPGGYNTETFIAEAKKRHPGANYDYSKVNYKGYDERITIVCPTHGAFEQLPYRHLQNKVFGSSQDRHCLVPMTGFYEWIDMDVKQPWYIQTADEWFTVAGLWRDWKDPYGDAIRTYTILTVPANDKVSGVHDRMPAIIDAKDRDRWLTTGWADTKQLLRPYEGENKIGMVSARVVNSGLNKSPDCVHVLTKFN